MFEGCSYLLTEMSFEIHSFETSRLEEINPALDLNLFVIRAEFSEQEIGTSRSKLASDFPTFLDLLEEKSNLGQTIELELKLLTTAHFFGCIRIQLTFVSR